MIARGLGVALAVAAIAWFALGVRQAHDTAAASTIVNGRTPLNAVQAAHARSLLHAAGQLNPDTEVNLLRAQLYDEEGRYRLAQAEVGRVVTKEPKNAGAWLALAHASGGNRRIFFTALIHIRALVPVVPPPR
jgi:predicted Zn-dependent protease